MPTPTKAIPKLADLREQFRSDKLTVTEYARALTGAMTQRSHARAQYGYIAPDQMRASDKREVEQHESEFAATEAALTRLQMDYPDDPVWRVQIGNQALTDGQRRAQEELVTLPVVADPTLCLPLGASGAGVRGQVLDREQRVADWCSTRTPTPPEHRDLSLGLMLRGWLTSRWDGAEREQRALLEGSQAGGGVLVPTPLSAQIIDRARNASRCFQAGARVVPMDSQTLKVPRLAGSPTPAWRAENAQIAEGDLTFDSITFTARSMALIVKCSRELIEDGRDVDGVVARDLAAQVATELDRVMLRGTGTAPEPRGLRNTSGVTVTAFGGANGAVPTNYDHLLDAVQVIRGGNFEPNAVIASPRSSTTLSKLKASDGQYLAPPPALADLRMLTTNQVPTNLTTGTSTDTTEVYVGDWSNLWLGMRTELVLGTLVERYAEFGQVAFMVWLRGDVQLAQPAAFNVLTGVRP